MRFSSQRVLGTDNLETARRKSELISALMAEGSYIEALMHSMGAAKPRRTRAISTLLKGGATVCQNEP